MIITIDGTQCVGKTETGKELAKLTGFTFINTGAMFKATAYKGLEYAKECAKAGQYNLSELQKPEIVQRASTLAEDPHIREQLKQLQRDIVRTGGNFILEGRDAGTVVFPDADFKFFMDARLEVRARRATKILPGTEEELKKLIAEIDDRDKKRMIAPLKIADDAIYYDNSDTPTAKEDAIVLWHYITRWDEIKKNVARRGR